MFELTLPDICPGHSKQKEVSFVHCVIEWNGFIVVRNFHEAFQDFPGTFRVSSHGIFCVLVFRTVWNLASFIFLNSSRYILPLLLFEIFSEIFKTFLIISGFFVHSVLFEILGILLFSEIFWKLFRHFSGFFGNVSEIFVF